MKIIILAAGVGSRLRPLTLHKPKCMVNVNDKPILQYAIDNYLAAGVKQESICIVIGYLADIVRNFISNNYPKIVLVENKEYNITNNMYSLYLAFKYLPLNEIENVIINNGDNIYDPKTINDFISCERDNIFACKKGFYHNESMKVVTENGRIVSISKELDSSKSYGVSIDLHKLNSSAVKKLKEIITDYIEIKNERNFWTETALKDLFSFVPIEPWNAEGEWTEIDTIDDLAEANILFGNLMLNTKRCIIIDFDEQFYNFKKNFDNVSHLLHAHAKRLSFYSLTHPGPTHLIWKNKIKKFDENMIKEKYNLKDIVLIGNNLSAGIKFSHEYGCDFVFVMDANTKSDSLVSFDNLRSPLLVIRDLNTLSDYI